MNFKYIKNIIPAAAVALSLGMSSCVGDLDVTPIDPSTNMTIDCDALFAKCYANMAVAGNGGANGDCDIDGLDGGTTGFVRQLFNANALTTDEAICCWGDEGIGAFNYNQWGASHPMLKGFYYRLYFGVTMCNFYLTEAADHDATMTAEVRFLRALYYYHLMDLYGNVPFLTEMSAESAPQASRQEVYNFVEKELLDIEGSLKEPRTNTYGRVDKAAAWMLLARLYLNAEVYTGTPQWQKAADYAKKVMTSGYDLFKGGNDTWSSYQMLFMGDNGENGAKVEAILPLLQDGKETTSWGTSLFLIASTFNTSMTVLNGNTNGTSEAWGGNRARPDLVDKFFPNGDCPEDADCWQIKDAAHDDRALFWSKGFKYNVEQPSEFTDGYGVAKFTNFYSDGSAAHDSQFPDTDWFLMRAAEAWLTFAEADMRANGGVCTPAAKEALNELRARAHAEERNTFSLNDVCDEWSREFYFEGYRRPVLIRFGRFGGNNDYKWQWKGGSMAGTTFSSNLNVFAIPDTDLNANSKLTQNPGY